MAAPNVQVPPTKVQPKKHSRAFNMAAKYGLSTAPKYRERAAELKANAKAKKAERKGRSWFSRKKPEKATVEIYEPEKAAVEIYQELEQAEVGMPKVEELELLNPVNMTTQEQSKTNGITEESDPAPDPVPPPEKGIIMFTKNGNCPNNHKEHTNSGTCYKKLSKDEIAELKKQN